MRIINLLPKSRQEDIRYEKILSGLFLVMWISLASFILVFLIQFGSKIYLESRLGSFENKIQVLKEQVNKDENAQIKAEITGINNKIADYKNLADNMPKWSQVLKAFAVLPPEGIVISSFTVDPTDRSVVIRGNAATRELVIELHDNIENDSENFYNINYPLENLVQPVDVDFHFTFYINDELLK